MLRITMNKARVLSALVSVYTALWFTLDGAWFFKWHAVTVLLSILLVALSFSALFFMKRTRHAILLSAAEFSWILFNVFWIRFDLGEVRWCEPVAICFLVSGLLCLAVAIGMRALSKVQQPFDSFVFRRLKL
jgi:hypothetical protein